MYIKRLRQVQRSIRVNYRIGVMSLVHNNYEEKYTVRPLSHTCIAGKTIMKYIPEVYTSKVLEECRPTIL